jgi:hypothetical protein
MLGSKRIYAYTHGEGANTKIFSQLLVSTTEKTGNIEPSTGTLSKMTTEKTEEKTESMWK